MPKEGGGDEAFDFGYSSEVKKNVMQSAAKHLACHH